MFSYFAFGLAIESAIPLPELLPAAGGRDVSIRLADYASSHLLTDNSGPDAPLGSVQHFSVTEGEVILALKDMGIFRVRRGQEVLVTPSPETDLRLIQLCLVGTVMSVLLYQRGLLVLHASCVAVSGGAVAFVANSGGGKSTMAAALHARGHTLLADDLTAVNMHNGRLEVRPAFPQLKLDPAAADSLGYHARSLYPLHALIREHGYRVGSGMAHGSCPLRCIYLLEETESQGIERVKPSQAVLELLGSCYGIHRFHELTPPGWPFLQCSRLAREIPVCSLKRPRSLPALPEIADLVEAHLRSESCLP